MAKKEKWSKDRPVKPDVDPLYLELVEALQRDRRSMYAKANVSGLSQATLNNWVKRKVRRPQGVSMQMCAKALGLKITLVEDTGNGRS